MHGQKVISKGKYLYSQKIGAVTVDSYVVFEEDEEKFLLLRLLNGRAEILDGFTLKVTQYDAAGKPISSEHYRFEAKSYGANSRFVADKKIPLGKDCAEFRANVLSATYGNYRYVASDEGVIVDYIPEKSRNSFDTSDKLKSMKGQRLAVRSSKLGMSLILGLFAVIMTAGICALGFFNLDYFKETATGFMKDGVEYRFIDGDKSKNGKLAVAGYSGAMGVVNIPSRINGYPVSFVDAQAFMDNDRITEISFGGDITIRSEAFSNCSSLNVVDFENVVSVGDNAFSNCTNLCQVDSQVLSYIGYKAFSGCQVLNSVNIGGEGSVYIGGSAFSDCDSLSAVTIEKDIDFESYDGVFSSCYSLGSLTLASFDAAEHNLAELFGNDVCPLRELKIGELNVIGDSFCQGMEELESVAILGLSDWKVGDYAFADCVNLCDVYLEGNISEIGNNAFENCRNLSYFDLSDDVFRINDYAFSGCVNLRLSYLPEHLTEIGVYAFGGCDNINISSIPETVINIGDHAFSNCSSIVSLTIPESIQTMGFGMLEGCTSLSSLKTPFAGGSRYSDTYLSYMFGGTDWYSGYNVPYSLKTVEVTDSYALGESAFYGCNNIESITLNEGITQIGRAAFCSCGSLSDIVIPETVTDIGDEAFNWCSSLRSIELPRQLASIGGYAFSSCYALESLEIPESVQYIGFSALYDCTSLSSLTTPFVGGSMNSDTYLSYMFGGTDWYSGYTVPQSLRTVEVTDSYALGESAFYGCGYIENVSLNEGITDIGNRAFSGCASLESIELPDGVVYIGMNAFESCSRLTSVRLPSTLQTIDDGAFANCYRLYSVFNYSPLNLICGMPDYGNVAKYAVKIYSYGEEAERAEENGYEFICFDDGWYLVAVPDGQTSFGLPSSFYYNGRLVDEYSIPHHLFYDNADVEEIFFPDSVIGIGENAFDNCNNLVRAEFSQTSPLTEIPSRAFADCRSLTQVVLPGGLRIIGNQAFANCIMLGSFTVGAEVSMIGDEAFSYCCRLLEVYNYSLLDIVAGSTDYGCIAMYALVVYGTGGESEVEFVTVDGLEFAVRGGEWYLVGCDDGISELRLEAFDYGGQHIDSFSVYPYAFIQNMQLTSVYIGDAVTSIGAGAFSECANLTEAVFDNARITRIEDSAFEYCYSLVTLVLPENVREIGENAFRGSMIAAVDLPDSLEVIERYAFTNTYIEQLELPSSLERLDDFAFAYCYELVSVTVNSDVEMEQEVFSGDNIKIVNNFSNLEIFAGDWNNGGIAINAVYVNTDPSEEIYIVNEDPYVFAFIYGEWTLLSYDGYTQTVTLPESFVFEDSAVSSYGIASGAFNYVSATYLVIPESVSSIAEGAFYMCSISYVCYSGTADEWEKLCTYGCGLEYVEVLYYADCVHDSESWTYDEYGNLVTQVSTNLQIIRDATCAEEGEGCYICAVCGDVISTYSIDKLPHTPNSDGVCTVCGAQGEVVGAGGYLPSYVADDAVNPFAVDTDGTLTMTGTAPGSSSTLILTAEQDIEVFINMNLSPEIYAEIQVEGALYGYGGGYYTAQFTVDEGGQLTIACSVDAMAQYDGEMSFSIIFFEI